MTQLYFDHAATSFPKAPGVAEAAARFLGEDAGNAGRGVHRLANRAADALSHARRALAELIGAPSARLALAPGATFALNAALQGLLERGDRVVVGPEAHTSVLRPLRLLGAEVQEVRSDDVLRWDLEHLAQLLEQPTRLVVVAHGSNVTGAVQDLAGIAARCTASGARLLVDGAQTVGALPLDVDALGVDALAFSGHKGLLGPTGSGGLYLREGLELRPWITGGSGSRSHDEAPPAEFPGALEVGTPNAWAFATLSPALTWIADQTPAALHARTAPLAEALRAGLRALPQVTVFAADQPQDLPVVSFTVEGWRPQELAVTLDALEVSLRAGLHCAPRAHRRLGTEPDGTLRASLGPFLAADDVAEFLARLREVLG
ncbi:MAG: aminotransferase class V-fold PLP-dependent enzyme [Planctomycetes bacterium]|nr:aminotransferase class V-fold PLP-dependent enzyme [Planctomycetota bacterium]